MPGGLTILNANDEHVAAMSAIAPADVLWFGLPQKEDAQLDTTALDVRCDDLDHPSFVLEDKTGRHANVTLGISRTAQRHERACRSHGGDDVGHAD